MEELELHNPKFEKKGYIQVYWGNGKSKTCASMGLALRALGQGWKVLIFQFTKGGDKRKYGEYNGFMALQKEYKDRLKYLNCGLDKFIWKSNLTDEDRYNHQKAWFYVLHNASEYDLVVLDELNIAIDLDIIHLNQVLDFLDNKPKNLEVVITGRNAKQEIRDIANLVTEMVPEKHYFEKGVTSRKGIEY